VRKSLMKPLAIPLDRHTTPTKWLVMLKLFWAIAGLALYTSVHAVGMGGINVTSALGQPLKAEIDLMTVSKAEKGSLVARLASTDAYKSAGLDYPYGNKFKFEIQNRADGEPYIKVSSAQAINDPFVSLLVELSWSAGKLSREYTFLLDPVDYVPVQPAPVAVKPVAPALQPAEAAQTFAASSVPEVQVANSTSPVVPVTSVEQSAVQAVPGAASAVPEAANEAAAKSGEQAIPVAVQPEEQAASAVQAVPEKKETIEVHRGDTMYKIAAQYKLADMNLERMLVALYRANADQFDGKNMNRIRAGKILRLPSQDEYEQVTLSAAVKEIHAQAADWNAYRQKLASAATPAGQPQAAQQVASSQQIASGKISSSVLDNAPVAKESAKEVLKLSKGEAPGDQTATGAGGKALSVQDSKNAAQEDAIAKAKAEQEEKMRAAMLEKNIQDMKRLAQLKTEAAALAQPRSAVAAVAPAKPAPTAAAKPKPKEVKPEPSLLDQILSEPLYLAGGAAALLVLGMLGITLQRRKKKRDEGGEIEETGEDIGSTTGRMTQPVVPSPDTGDFTRAFAAQPAPDALQSESVDPISEADLFLNFGRDVQAEEILKEALQSTPNNHQIHLKLLGIYASRKDANSFSALARKLQDSGDDEAWQQAVEMGRKLEPDNPLYGGSGFASMEDTGSATVQVMAYNATPEPPAPAQASALDFDFGAGAPAAQATAEQDFLGGEDKTMVLSGGQGMDFDITSTNPAMPAAESETLSDTGDMIFDVTGSHSYAAPAQPEQSKPADEMPFTLDFPTEAVAEKPAPAAPPGGMTFAGISLNFDDTVAAPSEPAPQGADDQWQEVSTKLDLAKAYQEMGDNDGAREILEEVMREGDAKQREAAQTLFDQLI
jgi:pilus assembly protein FimV